MRRREFIGLIGGAAAWPVAIGAQQPDAKRYLGVLVGLAENDPDMIARLAGLRQGLARRGWSEGRNIRIDYRFAPAGVNAKTLAKELVASEPDVILGHTVTIAAALQSETWTIPIVFVSVADPIGSGFISSLARPGGNLTGLMTFEPGIAGKWCSMLKEVNPRIKRAAFMANPEIKTYEFYLRAAQTPAEALGLELVPRPVKNVAEITNVFEEFGRSPDSGIIVPPDVFTASYGEFIIALAAPASQARSVWVRTKVSREYRRSSVPSRMQQRNYT